MLSLTEALKTGRLQEFIAEREAAGVGPISETDFLSVSAKLIKHEQSEDQTSRSASPDGSTEK